MRSRAWRGQRPTLRAPAVRLVQPLAPEEQLGELLRIGTSLSSKSCALFAASPPTASSFYRRATSACRDLRSVTSRGVPTYTVSPLRSTDVRAVVSASKVDPSLRRATNSTVVRPCSPSASMTCPAVHGSAQWSAGEAPTASSSES